MQQGLVTRKGEGRERDERTSGCVLGWLHSRIRFGIVAHGWCVAAVLAGADLIKVQGAPHLALLVFVILHICLLIHGHRKRRAHMRCVEVRLGELK